MFGNFSGQTRRPRQVNLAGRKNQDPFKKAGAKSTIDHARLEREARHAKIQEKNATQRIQRVWRGRREAGRVRKQLRDEWDLLTGFSNESSPSQAWTMEEVIRNSVLFVHFFNRKGSIQYEELLRAGYLCQRIVLDRRDENLDYFVRRVFKVLVRRMDTLTLGRDLPDHFQSIAQIIKFLGRTARVLPELAVQEYQTLTLPPTRSISYYDLLSRLSILLSRIPTSHQNVCTTPAITFAARSPLHSTDVPKPIATAISRDLATKFICTGDLPTLLSAGDGYDELCKDPALFTALVDETEYTVPETYRGLDVDKQLWLLSTIIHVSRSRGTLSLGGEDIEYLGFLSSMLGAVSKEVAKRIDLEDLNMADSMDLDNVKDKAQPLPGFVKDQIKWLCQKSTIATLLERAIPLDSPRALSEARILASYALTLIHLFPSQRQDLRMWLCMSTTSDGTAALQYFWKAARQTEPYKRIQESNGDRKVVKMLKTKSKPHKDNVRRDRDWCIIFLFLELYSLMLTVMDDDDFFSGQKREVIKGTKGAALPIKEVIELSVFLKNFGFGVYWNAQQLMDDPSNPQGGGVFESDHKAGDSTSLIGLEGMTVSYVKGTVTSLLKQLYMRDSRRRFCPKDHWLMTSHFDMDGFIKDVVHEEEERRIAELNTSDDEDEDEEDMSGTPRISSTQQQVRKNFLSSIGPRLDIVQNLPFFIPFETRVQIFREFIHSDQVRRREGATGSSMSRHAFDRWDEMGMGMERGARHHGTIRREKLFDDAIKEFYDLGETLKEPIQITFIDKFGEAEAGIDGGGVTKEFLTSVTKEAFVPSEDGLFCENKDHYLFPNPASILAVRTRAKEFGLSPETTQEQVKDVLKRYEFLGRVVGKCLYEGILLEIGFAGFFLLKWAFKGATNDGYRPSVNDLRDLDEDLYNGMITLKNYTGDVEHELFIDFTYTTKVLGRNHTVELRPNGANIPVTNANRLEYIHLVSRYHLQTQSEPQTNAFLRGLGLIIRPSWLAMFNQVELQILVAGDLMNAIDVQDLRRHTVYGGVYQLGVDEFGRKGPEHEVIKWFWEVMEEASDEDRRKVLKFVTSVSRAPLLGFKALQPRFSIRDATSTGPMGEMERLPSASTCVNLLKLPRYRDKETLREKLMYAVNSGAGFDLS